MTLESCISMISTNGLAVVLVIWGTYRIDKFLTQICNCLDIYNRQLNSLDTTLIKLTLVIDNLQERKT